MAPGKLLTALESREVLFVASSVALGLAVAWAAWTVLAMLTQPRRQRLRTVDFEDDRRGRLRTGSRIYRWLEPVVDALAGWRRGSRRAQGVQRLLLLTREKLPWQAEEYLALVQLQGLLAGLAGMLLGLFLFESLVGGLLVGMGVAFGYQQVVLHQLAERGQRHLRALEQRLPFAIDLMALMMEAGASFPESMATVVRESAGHPLAEELGEVLREVSLGRPRHEALASLQQRLLHDDVSEIVYAVNKGEELGTPLAQILRSQAEQMRLKRSQRIEKASAEAQVNVVFPGMVIMVACLLLIVAPFILASLQSP